MQKNKKKRLIRFTMSFLIIVIIILIIMYFNILSKKMTSQPKYNKVLVIGIDGMDPKITSKLMTEGKLPNFKKLAETGSFINLNTSYPPQSPVAWTCISTGVNPGKHNMFDFIKRNPEIYMPKLFISKSVVKNAETYYESYVKAAPFWRVTTKAGFPTTVIRWPITFPPERIKGNMLSGLGVPDIKGFLSGYTFYSSMRTDKSDKPSNKIIQVSENNGLIKTEISGPVIRKSNDIIDVKTPILIKIYEKSADIIVNDNVYHVNLNEWSRWIRAKFKVGMFKNVYSIFKAYLISTDPFEMYITTLQLDPKNPVKQISSPVKYSSELAEDIGLYYTLGSPEETDGYVDNKLSKDALIEQINEIEEQRDKMFWKEFKEFSKKKKGVYAFVYDSSDKVQHVFWDEKILDDNNKELSVNKVVIDYYIKKDNFIGELIEKIDNETLLIIVSDHGFTSFERAVSVNTWLVENGFMTLTKELAENEEGPLFQYVDWSKTKAYSLGFNSIYINLKDREANGIVEDREKIVNEIITKIENLTDPKTGKKVINKAYKREEIYNGDYIKNAPDIIIGFNPGYRMAWETAVGGFTKETIYENTKKWKGDHLIDPKFVPGVLFSNIKFDKESASQMDVVPTVLDALGIEIPKEIDGKSLLE